MERYLKTDRLAIGYNRKVLLRDIDIELEKGKIYTLIGPNGSGKSTLLKTIAAQLSPVSGAVYLDSKAIGDFTPQQLAKELAIVTTERIDPELMTCAEVAAMGRYPHTGAFGVMSSFDEQQVNRALIMADAIELAKKRFSACSDGQKQRIMIARAICQQTKVIILDEPTAYLDIRHKIELLDLLRELAQKEQLTVIMSLHEIDLAVKASDTLLLVTENGVKTILAEDAAKSAVIEQLYGLDLGCYSPILGSFELKKPKGEPQHFVIGMGSSAIGCYRQLKRKDIPFFAGIIFENDIALPIACSLAKEVITAQSYEPMTKAHFDKAAELMLKCKAVLSPEIPCGSLNEYNRMLIKLAESNGILTQNI